MKTVIDRFSGDVLFAIDDFLEVELRENEQLIDGACDLSFDYETQKQVFNLESQTFEVVNK